MVCASQISGQQLEVISVWLRQVIALNWERLEIPHVQYSRWHSFFAAQTGGKLPVCPESHDENPPADDDLGGFGTGGSSFEEPVRAPAAGVGRRKNHRNDTIVAAPPAGAQCRWFAVPRGTAAFLQDCLNRTFHLSAWSANNGNPPTWRVLCFHGEFVRPEVAVAWGRRRVGSPRSS